MRPTHPCPKCNRLLTASGLIPWDGEIVPLFLCKECLIETDFFGERMELSLTFAVDRAGRVFDPAAPDKPFDFTAGPP